MKDNIELIIVVIITILAIVIGLAYDIGKFLTYWRVALGGL